MSVLEACERGYPREKESSEEVDDEGRAKRTGTMWTAIAHIITAVIGSGVLSLAWAVAQLGWIAGTGTLLIFAFITFYTSTLLADCYRSPDPATGRRNHTYIEAVRTILGGTKNWICAITQYVNLFGISIAYTITASISMEAIQRSNCFHSKGHGDPCKSSSKWFIVGFGVIQVFLSQIPNFHKLWWLSSVAAVMSFFYSLIGLCLAFSRIISEGISPRATVAGAPVGIDVTVTEKVWTAFRAIGNIAAAYTFSIVLVEIQDTVRASPPENKTMKKASLVGVSTTTLFYMLCGCMGYAAFGYDAPGNMLTGFGFYEPFWLIDFANICIVVHLVGAFQLIVPFFRQIFCQPLYAAFETWVARKWPEAKFMTREHSVVIGKISKYKINILCLVSRTVFVGITTVLSMTMPFFNDIIGLFGALGFWPLTVYFPIEMCILQRKIKKFTVKWTGLQILSLFCLLVSTAAACGSIQGMVEDFRVHKPFKSS